MKIGILSLSKEQKMFVIIIKHNTFPRKKSAMLFVKHFYKSIISIISNHYNLFPSLFIIARLWSISECTYRFNVTVEFL